MKILLVHNVYQQHGGENVCVERERRLLKGAGHEVINFIRHNNDIHAYGPGSKLALGWRTVWASDSHRELRALLKRERPDLAHFHNTLPLISPAAYYACHDAGVPVVQTLHNYRLLCPAAVFFRKGALCKRCVEHTLWRSVRHACYRNSRPATAAVALMLAIHRRLGTWHNLVDAYVALTEFSRSEYIAGGLPAEKIFVKPNFVDDSPGQRAGDGEYAVFVGRLSAEKGLHTLLEAWRGSQIPLLIVGDGPLRPELEARSEQLSLSGVRFLKALPREGTMTTIQRARFLIFPSEYYETFGYCIVEAFACGVPAIVSGLGAMKELVADGRTGLHFEPGNPHDLRQKVDWAWTHPEPTAEMGQRARQEFEAKYTPEKNYSQLMAIYGRVLARRAPSRSKTKRPKMASQ